MDGIKQQQFAQQQLISDRRQTYQLKKMQRDYRAELDKIKTKNEIDLNVLRKNYGDKLSLEEQQLERKLIELRKKNDNILENESKRYDKLREEAKLIHEDKIAEIKITQDKEVHDLKEGHTRYMDNMHEKFQQEKYKLES